MAKKLMTPRSKNTPVSWALKHKLVSLALTCPILVVSIWGVYSYVQYQQKFSKDDFEKLTAMAESVLHKTSEDKVDKNLSCSYVRPSEFDSLHLFCMIEVVAYVPYVDDAHAIVTAHQYETFIKDAFGTAPSSLSDFYNRPKNNSDTITVVLDVAMRNKQCNFQIKSNHYAQEAATFLPEKATSDLIALRFECSAESRAEYFPVTYRQG